MRYINIKNGTNIETVDQFETFKEAYKMLKEYRLSDPYNFYYISQRCTKEWKKGN